MLICVLDDNQSWVGWVGEWVESAGHEVTFKYCEGDADLIIVGRPDEKFLQMIAPDDRPRTVFAIISFADESEHQKIRSRGFSHVIPKLLSDSGIQDMISDAVRLVSA